MEFDIQKDVADILMREEIPKAGFEEIREQFGVTGFDNFGATCQSYLADMERLQRIADRANARRNDPARDRPEAQRRRPTREGHRQDRDQRHSPRRRRVRMTTPSRISANRQNAAMSTGPKTQAGKRRASGNALRYGLTGQMSANADLIQSIAKALAGGLAPAAPALEVAQLEDLNCAFVRPRPRPMPTP